MRHLLALLGFKRKSRPEDIPKLLPAETLEQAMAEARRLRAAHGVDVASLSPGELPIPRRADDER